jgi:gas vesicle structural protein
MPSKPPRAFTADQDLPIAGRVLDAPDSSLLDVLDNLLNKGVVVSGDVTLGVAGIDLIYLRLSSILCAADRVLPADRRASRKPSRHGKPSGGRYRR